MKWREPGRREYYDKYKRVELKHDQSWFECYQLPGNVFAICEPQHLQEVNCYLIVGSQRALLLDTGLGIRDIKAVVRELYPEPGELIVVNSHFHFDHVGGNSLFDKVFIGKDSLAIKQASTGIPHGFLKAQLKEDAFLYDYPEGFLPEDFSVEPYNAQWVEDGHVFDLGDREIEFFYAPGHTQDHYMLYDRIEKVLYGGDMIYYGVICVQFESDTFGYSNLEAYVHTLNYITEKYSDVKRVYTSHGDFIMDADCIALLRDALISIRNGKAEKVILKDDPFAFPDDPPELNGYEIGKYFIITR